MRGLKWNKKILKDKMLLLLTQELRRISRAPALIYNNPDQSPESLHLQYYEIVPSEAMHDVAGHIQNLFEEIPNHVLKPDNKKVNNNLEELKKVIELSMEEKEVKRGRTLLHYRCGLLKVTHYMKDMQLLLETLAETQCILYASEKDRTPHEIFCDYTI